MQQDDDFQPATTRKGRQKASRNAQFAPKATGETKEGDNDAFRISAVDWIKENKAEIAKAAALAKGNVACLMFYKTSGGGLAGYYGYSGYPTDMKGKLQAIRETHGIAADKATVCGEEHVIAEHPDVTFLFSISYHKEHKFISACSAGCKTLLAKRNIEDLKKYV
jgi:hypothetical protein